MRRRQERRLVRVVGLLRAAVAVQDEDRAAPGRRLGQRDVGVDRLAVERRRRGSRRSPGRSACRRIGRRTGSAERGGLIGVGGGGGDERERRLDSAPRARRSDVIATEPTAASLRNAVHLKRVIPCLDVDAGRVVKGTNFVNLRDAGDPVELAERYDAEGADELIFLDITATHEKRDTIVDLARRTAENVFIPFTIGGGIRSVADAQAVLDAGADKISVNSAAVARPELVSELGDRLGAQCVVLAIDARSDGERLVGGVRRRRPHAGRTRCGRVGARGRRARRRRDHAHVDGPRRHGGRLRPRAHARRQRGRRRPGHRLRRRRDARPPRRGAAGRRRRGSCGLDLPLRHVHDRARRRRAWRRPASRSRRTEGTVP